MEDKSLEERVRERVREGGEAAGDVAARTVESATGVFTRAMQDMVTIGLAWLQYGFEVGRHVLETSARSLQSSSSTIGELTASFGRRTDQGPPEPQPT